MAKRKSAGLKYVAPEQMQNLDYQAKRDYEKRKTKEKNRHDYGVATFSIIGGMLGGLISSVIFWLLTR